MTVVRTLGKNTLGDNNKMKVAMRERARYSATKCNKGLCTRLRTNGNTNTNNQYEITGRRYNN